MSDRCRACVGCKKPVEWETDGRNKLWLTYIVEFELFDRQQGSIFGGLPKLKAWMSRNVMWRQLKLLG